MESVHKGTLKNISVAMEDRQGGRKHITHVAHFETFSIDPSELAGQLQRKFKVGGRIFAISSATPCLHEATVGGKAPSSK